MDALELPQEEQSISQTRRCSQSTQSPFPAFCYVQGSLKSSPLFKLIIQSIALTKNENLLLGVKEG
jgi:hypothetical protein